MIVAIYMLCSATCVSIEARAAGEQRWTRADCRAHIEQAHVQATAAGARMLMGSCVRRKR